MEHHGLKLWPPPSTSKSSKSSDSSVTWKGRAYPVPTAHDALYHLREFVRLGGETQVPHAKGKERVATLFGARAPAERFWNDWIELLPAAHPLRGAQMGDVKINFFIKGDEKKWVPVAASNDRFEAIAKVDGKAQPISQVAVDRPGIFRGRNATADLSGRIRRRLTAEDVTLNLSDPKKAPAIPKGCGTRWGTIVSDPFVDWIASWRDPVTQVMKYARLATTSDTEQHSMRTKFDLAARFSKPAVAHALQQRIRGALVSKDVDRRQLGACMWLIDRLAIRVGSGTVESAIRSGAHGASTLLASHLEFSGQDNKNKHEVRLSFPGKDGVVYERVFEVPSTMLVVLKECKKGKSKPTDALFDRVNVSQVTTLLGKIVPDATAKVLRTCRASALFDATMAACLGSSSSIPEKKRRAVLQSAILIASARVSVLLNHRLGGGGGDLGAYDRVLDELVLAMKDSATQDLGEIKRRLREEVIRPARLALATARNNYVDPRIVFGHSKRVLGPAADSPLGPAYEKRFAWAKK